MRHALVFLALSTMLSASPGPPDTIRVLSSVAVRPIVEALVPEFERSTGHVVSRDFGIAAAVSGRIDQGESFDVAILTPALLDGLAAKGHVERGPHPVIGRSGLAFMVKAGAAKPDVSTVAAFTRSILAARAITYVSTGASGIAFLATLEKLGIADAVKAKARPVTSGDDVNANILSGAADLAVLPISEILPVRGADVGGVFPSDVQTFVVMAAGVNPRSSHAVAARAFVAYLTDPKNTPVIRASGMER